MIYDKHTGEITHIHNYSINPTSICRYTSPASEHNYKKTTGPGSLSYNHEAAVTNVLPKFKRPDAQLSSKAKRRINKSIAWLSYLSKPVTRRHPTKNYKMSHQIALITLTLPARQIHTDNEIKNKCLNQFLTEMRSVFHMYNYVWKAELQENGNVHFHIVTDSFIDYRIVRTVWNRCVNKLGYIDRYRAKFENMSFNEYANYRNCKSAKEKKQLLTIYQNQKRLKWSEPNSTDIHKTKNVKKLSAYIRKYISKSVVSELDKELESTEQKGTGKVVDKLKKENAVPGKNYCVLYQGKIWNRSKSLSSLSTVHEFEQSEFESRLRNYLESNYVYTIRDEYFEVYCLNINEVGGAFKKMLSDLLTGHAVENGYKSYAELCGENMEVGQLV